MGASLITELTTNVASSHCPGGCAPEEMDETKRRELVRSLLATLDAMNSEVEEKIRCGEVDRKEIEEFLGSLDRHAT